MLDHRNSGMSMMFLFLSLIFGVACGFLYALNFVRRYAVLAEQSGQIAVHTTEKNTFIKSISVNSFFRHMVIGLVLIVLFLYIKLNLIFWLVGFLFSFWYGVLSSVNRKRKE